MKFNLIWLSPLMILIFLALVIGMDLNSGLDHEDYNKNLVKIQCIKSCNVNTTIYEKCTRTFCYTCHCLSKHFKIDYIEDPEPFIPWEEIK